MITAMKEHTQLQIENNSRGHSYEKVFGHLLDVPRLSSIEVQDPYIRSTHQVRAYLKSTVVVL